MMLLYFNWISSNYTLQDQLPNLIHVFLLFFSYVELYFFPYTSVRGVFLFFNPVQEIAFILDIIFT